MNITEIIGVLGGLTGLASLLSVILTWRKSQAEARKADADGISSIVSATSQLVDDLREESCRLRQRVGELQERLDLALTRVDALESEREDLIKRIRCLESDLEALQRENEQLRISNIALVRSITSSAP